MFSQVFTILNYISNNTILEMSRIKINLTEELKKIFKRDDMYTNNRILKPTRDIRWN